MVTWKNSTVVTNGNISHNETADETAVLWQMEAAYYLFLCVSPVLILGGSFGNVLCLVILNSSAFEKSPFTFLLSVLVVVDTGVLNTGLLRHWLRVVTHGELDIRSMNTIGCKIHVFLSYLFPHLSSWTLMLMAIWRAVSVVTPFRVKVISNSTQMILLWLVMTSFFVLLNIHLLVIFDLISYTSEDGNGETVEELYCFVNDTHRNFFSNVWSWIDLVVVALLPLVVITVCNAIIIHKLFHPQIMRHRSSSMKGRKRPPGSSPKSTTMMLITLSIVFFVTTIPWGIYFVGLPYWPYETEEDSANLELVYTVCNLVYCANNATNFALYCLSGTKFRTAVQSVLCNRGKAQLRTSSRTSGVTSSRNQHHTSSVNRNPNAGISNGISNHAFVPDNVSLRTSVCSSTESQGAQHFQYTGCHCKRSEYCDVTRCNHIAIHVDVLECTHL